MKEPNVKKSILYWIFGGVSALVLLILVLHPYFSLDEPNVLWSLRNDQGWTGYFRRVVAEGRPLLAYIQFNALEWANTFENFKYFRILTLILLFLFCWLFYRFLRKKNVEHASAFLISVLIFCLPGFTVYIGWTLIPHCISILMSFYAGILTARVFEVYLGSSQLSRSKENIFICVAILLQIVSLFIYQISALVFVVPAFITLILKPGSPLKNRLQFFTVTSVIFIICLIIYYKLYASSLKNYHIEISERGKISNIDLLAKLKWFSGVLKDAGKLHLLLVRNEALSYICSLWIIFILVRDLVKKRVADIVFLFVFSLLLFLPHLIIAESWAPSRNFVFISLIFVFYTVIRSFEMLPSLSDGMVVLIGFVFIGILCMNLWEGWVKPMNKDYKCIREFSKKLPAIETDTLSVKFTLQPMNMHEKKSILKQYYDEFNCPLFFNDWAVEPALKCLYQDTHPSVSLEKINHMIIVGQKNGEKETANDHHFILKLEYQ